MILIMLESCRLPACDFRLGLLLGCDWSKSLERLAFAIGEQSSRARPNLL